MMLVFFRLMVRPNSVQVFMKQVISHCSESSVWGVRVMASANSTSLMRCARLKRLPSLLLWRMMPSSGCQKAR